MAIHAFLILCGLSVVFLVYVLAQFWKEGRPPQSGAEPVMVYTRQWNPNVIVVAHPISLNAHGGICVTPLQLQAPPKGLLGLGTNGARVLEMPARKRTDSPRSGALGSKIKAC